MFIDFEKVFHSTNRSPIWEATRTLGILQKIINAIKTNYENFTGRFLLIDRLSETIEVRSGGKRG